MVPCFYSRLYSLLSTDRKEVNMILRIAVVGLGGIAQKAYLPILAAWGGIDLLFCSRTMQTVEDLQAQYRVGSGIARLDELLEWQPQAAFVLAPTSVRYPIVVRLLDAGCDLFLEKPAASASEEMRRLTEQAEANGRILMVGFNRRYSPLHRLAHELWAEREGGDCPVREAPLQRLPTQPVRPLHRGDDPYHRSAVLFLRGGEGTRDPIPAGAETCLGSQHRRFAGRWFRFRAGLHGRGSLDGALCLTRGGCFNVRGRLFQSGLYHWRGTARLGGELPFLALDPGRPRFLRSDRAPLRVPADPPSDAHHRLGGTQDPSAHRGDGGYGLTLWYEHGKKYRAQGNKSIALP